MSKIYGTIGYVYLKKTHRKIIVLADQHDTLPSCENKINIAEWFKSKFKTSKILLEEVPREDNKLIELWQGSPHTQELKKLYLDNTDIMPGMDIRPFMIPFSWEVLDQIDVHNPDYDITMLEYLEEIDNFFSLQNSFIMKNLSNYNVNFLKGTLLGKHFILIKNRYGEFLESIDNQNLFDKKIKYLNSNHTDRLSTINNLLDDIMEWYICAQIELYNDKSIIIHAGLAHTDKIIDLLKNHYSFIIIEQEGINTLENARYEPRNGCIELKSEINNQFGGVTCMKKSTKIDLFPVKINLIKETDRSLVMEYSPIYLQINTTYHKLIRSVLNNISYSGKFNPLIYINNDDGSYKIMDEKFILNENINISLILNKEGNLIGKK